MIGFVLYWRQDPDSISQDSTEDERMKVIRSCLLTIVFALLFNACALREVQDTESAPASQLLPDKNTAESTETVEEGFINTETVAEQSPAESICGIEIVEYVNPYRVSEYYNLTEDQQIAFSVLCDALNDIIENGPVPDKSYTLPERNTFRISD